MEKSFINQILNCDALTGLSQLEDESVDTIMTSPPYFGLRKYSVPIIWNGNKDCEHDFSDKVNREINLVTGKNSVSKRPWREQASGSYSSSFCSKCNAWKGELGLEPTIDLYIDHLVQIFNEVKRVLKKTGSCWVVIGDSYMPHNGTRGNKTNAGADTLRNDYDNIGLAPMHKKQLDVSSKSLCMIPERFAIKMMNNGWILRNKIIWHKRNCMPSSAKDRFTIDYENVYFFTKSQKYYFNTQYEPYSEATMKEFGEKYNGKGIKDYESVGVQNPSDVKRRIIAKMPPIGGVKQAGGDNKTYSGNTPPFGYGRIKRTVWTINTKPFRDAHFAVFPEELVRTVIDSGCPENGIICDPFMGSGTVALVALKMNRNFIGIELNSDYVKMAYKRIDPYLKQEKLK